MNTSEIDSVLKIHILFSLKWVTEVKETWGINQFMILLNYSFIQ